MGMLLSPVLAAGAHHGRSTTPYVLGALVIVVLAVALTVQLRVRMRRAEREQRGR